MAIKLPFPSQPNKYRNNHTLQKQNQKYIDLKIVIIGGKENYSNLITEYEY